MGTTQPTVEAEPSPPPAAATPRAAAVAPPHHVALALACGHHVAHACACTRLASKVAPHTTREQRVVAHNAASACVQPAHKDDRYMCTHHASTISVCCTPRCGRTQSIPPLAAVPMLCYCTSVPLQQRKQNSHPSHFDNRQAAHGIRRIQIRAVAHFLAAQWRCGLACPHGRCAPQPCISANHALSLIVF
jgi:hypothetical protein